jgi:hypothetical protein
LHSIRSKKTVITKKKRKPLAEEGGIDSLKKIFVVLKNPKGAVSKKKGSKIPFKNVSRNSSMLASAV